MREPREEGVLQRPELLHGDVAVVQQLLERVGKA
jgi:hypothetical protein